MGQFLLIDGRNPSSQRSQPKYSDTKPLTAWGISKRGKVLYSVWYRWDFPRVWYGKISSLMIGGSGHGVANSWFKKEPDIMSV